MCIADEVQTGFGRSGAHYWMFEEHDVVPDIVTLGKPMGNGYPLAAVVCRREIADVFASSGIEYFNTFGGNNVACAIGEAVIDVVEEEGLQANAKHIGAYLKSEILKLKYEHGFAWIGDVRGLGFYQGVELIKTETDPGSDLRPHTELASFIVDFMLTQRIIVSRDGPHNNVLKIKPPMVFTVEHADMFIVGLRCALEAARKTGRFH